MKNLLSDIDTLILCGGKGDRLKSVIGDLPKILAPINGKPFIYYLLKFLEKNSIKKITLCTGYQHYLIEDWVNKSYSGGAVIKFSREKIPLGTAGALKNAENLIESNNVIIMNGDTFINTKLIKFYNFFLSSCADILVLLSQSKYHDQFGTVRLSNYGVIEKFNEKINQNRLQNIVNAGIYIFKREIVDIIQEKSFLSLEKDIFPKLIDDARLKIMGVIENNSFHDFGTPSRYQQIQNNTDVYLQ